MAKKKYIYIICTDLSLNIHVHIFLSSLACIHNSSHTHTKKSSWLISVKSTEPPSHSGTRANFAFKEAHLCCSQLTASVLTKITFSPYWQVHNFLTDKFKVMVLRHSHFLCWQIHSNDAGFKETALNTHTFAIEWMSAGKFALATTQDNQISTNWKKQLYTPLGTAVCPSTKGFSHNVQNSYQYTWCSQSHLSLYNHRSLYYSLQHCTTFQFSQSPLQVVQRNQSTTVIRIVYLTHSTQQITNLPKHCH